MRRMVPVNTRATHGHLVAGRTRPVRSGPMRCGETIPASARAAHPQVRNKAGAQTRATCSHRLPRRTGRPAAGGITYGVGAMPQHMRRTAPIAPVTFRRTPPGSTPAMSVDQLQILGILIAFAGMFLWGRWRHDLVAAGALLACAKVGWWRLPTHSTVSRILPLRWVQPVMAEGVAARDAADSASLSALFGLRPANR